MLYSQTEPVTEASSNIKFRTMTYWYEELLPQMQIAEISPWLNRWHAIYDFTQSRVNPDCENWKINSELDWNFIAPLALAEEQFAKV